MPKMLYNHPKLLATRTHYSRHIHELHLIGHRTYPVVVMAMVRDMGMGLVVRVNVFIAALSIVCVSASACS